ncbi:MAG: polysaccharide pyruvyl transferase family protein [Planctomycetota bacterium]
MKKYILEPNKKAVNNLCTGCGTCAGVCPNQTLAMEMTPEGKYIPQIAADNCQACQICAEICPVNKENISELNQFIFKKMPDNLLMGNFVDCYTGYSTDSTIRWNATSGGIITSLLIFLLRNQLIDGALLTRISRDDPLKAEPFIARTENDILSAMGSKYVPVALNQLLNQILSESGKFAVVGLPCHIQGIRRAELKITRLRDKIIYHFGLACSRTMTLRGVEYILHKMNISLNDIAELKYRGEGWPSGLKVSLKNGDKKSLPMLGTWWSEIFGGYFFSHYYCTLCGDVLNEMSDISFADAYLPEVLKSDKLGTSILITRTSIGEELIKAATGNNAIEVSTVSPEDVLKSQLFMSVFKKRNIRARVRLLKMLGRSIPRSLNVNRDAFLKPTFWDHIISPVPYINIFISKNRFFKSILERIPLKILTSYRRKYKKLLLRDAEETLRRIESARNEPIKIVVTNSHANNRGDEAAQRSMIHSIRAFVPNAQFTVLTTFPDGLSLQEGVKILKTFSASKIIGFLILLWTMLRALGLRLPTFRNRKLKIVREMAKADIIISAPGGPYFGDLYSSHEIREHLFHIFLSKILRKPVMIYAPSMGPFNSRKRNILRRYLLNKVEIITLRDHISKEYLDSLKLTRPLVYLTADSAFQDTINVEKGKIESIMIAEKIIDHQDEIPNRKPLVGITPTGPNWNFRDSVDAQEKQEDYNKIIAKTIDYLVDKFDATIVFFPQLYGKSDDVPLINEITSFVNKKDAVRVLSNKWNSEIQQAIISQMDFVIGNRYHSVIFSLKAEIPTICLAYEHKSVGIMQAAKLDKYVININDLTYELLFDKINQVWNQQEEIRKILGVKIPEIRQLSLKNSVYATALIKCRNQPGVIQEKLRMEIDKLIYNPQ